MGRHAARRARRRCDVPGHERSQPGALCAPRQRLVPELVDKRLLLDVSPPVTAHFRLQVDCSLTLQSSSLSLAIRDVLEGSEDTLRGTRMRWRDVRTAGRRAAPYHLAMTSDEEATSRKALDSAPSGSQGSNSGSFFSGKGRICSSSAHCPSQHVTCGLEPRFLGPFRGALQPCPFLQTELAGGRSFPLLLFGPARCALRVALLPSVDTDCRCDGTCRAESKRAALPGLNADLERLTENHPGFVFVAVQKRPARKDLPAEQEEGLDVKEKTCLWEQVHSRTQLFRQVSPTRPWRCLLLARPMATEDLWLDRLRLGLWCPAHQVYVHLLRLVQAGSSAHGGLQTSPPEFKGPGEQAWSRSSVPTALSQQSELHLSG
ncbi:hypothetical protein CB1_000327056 [Camelus ferus]|nr:hypothetical protein CB1_000327056 [Camelus ferus]